MALIALTGCQEDQEDHLAAARPEKVVLSERSEELRALIAAELAAGNKRIVIPPGRYRVQAERGSHLLFSNLSNVEIIAENVELVCTSTVRAVKFDGCSNVSLRGLTVDYDPLPFTQGKITAMAPDKSWIDFEVAEGYPENALREPVQIYNPATRTLRRGDARWNEEIKPLGNRRYRVSKAPGYRVDPADDTEQIGDILVAKNAYGKPGSPHAVELENCRACASKTLPFMPHSPSDSSSATAMAPPICAASWIVAVPKTIPSSAPCHACVRSMPTRFTARMPPKARPSFPAPPASWATML